MVGLTGRSSFLEWPAQLWLGRCGIKHLIPVQSCGFVVEWVLLHTSGLVQLRLPAAPVQMLRDWTCWRFGFLPVSAVSEDTRGKTPAGTLLICIFGGTFLQALSFGAAPTGGWE